MIEFGRNFEQPQKPLELTPEQIAIKSEQRRRTSIEQNKAAARGNFFMVPDGVYGERPTIVAEAPITDGREIVNFSSMAVQSTLERVSVEDPGLGVQIMNAGMRAGQVKQNQTDRI